MVHACFCIILRKFLVEYFHFKINIVMFKLHSFLNSQNECSFLLHLTDLLVQKKALLIRK